MGYKALSCSFYLRHHSCESIAGLGELPVDISIGVGWLCHNGERMGDQETAKMSWVRCGEEESK